jgi:hypothetical protein
LKKVKIIYCLLAAAWLLGPAAFFSQSGAPLKLNQLISSLEKKYGVVFSYDVDLVRDVPVTPDTVAKSLHQVLQRLSVSTAFHFENLSGKNVIVKPKSTKGNYILCGNVIDSKNKDPLIGTIIYETKGKFAISADETGSFHQIVHYNENDSVKISMVGYHPVVISMKLFGANGCSEISLHNIFSEMKEITVTAYLTQGISYDAMDNSITIHPRNLSILPGQTNGDVLLSLDALPGISTPDTKAGNLNIRGSTPDQTMIVFDDIPIYHKGHYFGTLSPFNSRVVDNIKVQRSTMSASSGGRAGGSIEISTANTVSNKFQGSVSSSLLDGSLYLNVPVKKNKVSFLFSARHSYPYSFNSPALTSLSDFVFQISEVQAIKNGKEGFILNKLTFNYLDANAKLIANLSEKHTASLSFLLVNNDMSISSTDKKATNRFDTVQMFNWGMNAALVSKWDSSFSTRLSFTNSYYRQNFFDRKNFSTGFVANSWCTNTASDTRLLFETDLKFNQRYSLKSGYDLRYHDMFYRNHINDTTSLAAPLDLSNKGFLHTAYLNLLSAPTDRLLLNAGVRVNYFGLNQKFSAEPRIALGFKVNKNFRLKSSAGLQKQFVTQISGVSVESLGGIENFLWILADDDKIPVVSSMQTSLGALFEKRSWLLDVEAYYKNTTDISYVSITNPDGPDPFIHGSLNTIGVDLLVRKHWKNLDAWVSYTLSKSLMQFDSVQAEPFYSLYDQTHVLDLAFSYRVKQWKFSSSWKYRTGLAALPGIRTKMIAGAPSNQSAQQNPPPGSPPPPASPGPLAGQYTDRFPDYHQLDISVSYTFPKTPDKWNGSVGLSGLNIYNRENIIGQQVDVINGKPLVQNRYGLGFMPNVVVTFAW